ncbi:AAA+ ATPase domain-containing protein [Methylorubrum populi]
MTDEIRRAERARAQRIALAPPDTVTIPPTLRQLRYGWPLFWGHPSPDLLAWSRSIPLDGLPRGVLDALATLDEGTVTVAVASALTEAFADAAADTRLTSDVRDDCREYASRCRFSTAWLGDYANAVLAMHETDVHLGGTFDDCERWALMLTRTEFSYLGHQILRDGHDPQQPVHRAAMRERACQELLSEAEVTQFWAGIERTESRAALRDAVRGPVRDDTGTDPRDPDFDPLDLGDEAEGAPASGLQVVPPLTHLAETRGGARAEFRDVADRVLPVTPAPDPEAVHAALLRGAPWAPAFADAVAQAQVGAPYARLPNLLLVSEPGYGKTSLALAAGEILGLPTTLYSAAGVADGMFGGTSRAYHTGRASVPLQAVRRSGMGTALIVVDEADKGGTSDHNGSLASALLPFLERASAGRLYDPYLECEVDLSGVSYVLTANDLSRVPAPLRDRCRVIHVPRPGREHLPVLAPRIAARLCRERGMHPSEAVLDAAEMESLYAFWRSGSLRELTACVAVCLDSRAHGMRH